MKINAIALIISTVVGILSTRLLFTFHDNMLGKTASFDTDMYVILLIGSLIQYLVYYYLKKVIK